MPTAGKPRRGGRTPYRETDRHGASLPPPFGSNAKRNVKKAHDAAQQTHCLGRRARCRAKQLDLFC